MSKNLDNSIDKVIERTLADNRLVGAVVKVAVDGVLVYNRVAGFADRERNKPMQENALFRLASVSKPIVLTAALQVTANF